MKNSIELINHKYVVYSLIHNNDIVYVGQTTNIYSRIGQHIKDKEFNAYSVLHSAKDYQEAIRLEKKYIIELSPKYNVTHNTMKDFIDRVGNRNIKTREKIRDIIDKYPDAPAKLISIGIGTGIKTVYKHLANLKKDATSISRNNEDDWGFGSQDEMDNFLNDGSIEF